MGVVAVFFLVLPTIQRSLNQAHNQELTAVLEQVNQKNQELADLTEEMEELKDQKGQAESRLQTIDGENQDVLSQYEGLIQVIQAYRADDFTEAVKIYCNLNLDVIQSEGLQPIIAQIRADMEANGYQVLAALGNTAAANHNSTEAMDYYQKAIQDGSLQTSNINFITGPSNSGDIEMVLIVGVHGPLDMEYVVVEDM